MPWIACPWCGGGGCKRCYDKGEVFVPEVSPFRCVLEWLGVRRVAVG
jgi:hypothetical protein